MAMPKPRPTAEKIEVMRMALRLSMAAGSDDCAVAVLEFEAALTVGMAKNAIAETTKIMIAFVAKFNDFFVMRFSCECFLIFIFDL